MNRRRASLIAGLLVATLLAPVTAPARGQEATPAACPAPAAEARDVSLAFHDAFATGEFDILADIVAEDAVWRSTSGGALDGPEGFAGFMGRVRAGFPDFSLTIEDEIIDGDLVIVRWTGSGTNTGPWGGVDPTGEARRWNGIHLLRVECGQIVDMGSSVDQAALFGLPGLAPVAATPQAAATPASCAPDDEATIRAAVERLWTEAWNGQDIDVYRDIVADDVIHHWTSGPDTFGQEAGAERLQAFFTGIPDLTLIWDEIAVDGDLAAAAWTLKGTQTGDLFGRAATRRALEYDGINIFRFSCGEIVEMWSEGDILRLQDQLSGS
jgi:predicted ester cyclase